MTDPWLVPVQFWVLRCRRVLNMSVRRQKEGRGKMFAALMHSAVALMLDGYMGATGFMW
jgi:hypothetical protein